MFTSPLRGGFAAGVEPMGFPEQRDEEDRVVVLVGGRRSKRGEQRVGAIRKLEDTRQLPGSSCEAIAEIGSLRVGQGSFAV